MSKVGGSEFEEHALLLFLRQEPARGVAIVPSMILSSACCTPSPDTSRTIEGLSDLREILSISPQGGRKHPQQEFLQVDTTNILFVCGGAFTGLEKIISTRSRPGSIGFGAKVIAPEDRKQGEIFRDVEPEDLLKYGLIPEFVGRLPVVATLEDLDEASLKLILTQPKNALLKQYQRLFEMEGVDLTVAEEALRAIARKAIDRKTGARGLRSIMEAILLDTMFDLRSLEGIAEVMISQQVVEGSAGPLYMYAARAGSVRAT